MRHDTAEADFDALLREYESPSETFWRTRCAILEKSRQQWMRWCWFMAVNYVGALIAILLITHPAGAAMTITFSDLGYLLIAIGGFIVGYAVASK